MYAGASWIKNSLKKEMSPLGEAVANLLGRVFSGIYHLKHGALDRVKWDDDYVIEFIYSGDMATVDFNTLTKLVVFAHDEMIRVDLCGCGPRYMRIFFHQRETRTGRIMEKCPTIESHVMTIRGIEKAS